MTSMTHYFTVFAAISDQGCEHLTRRQKPVWRNKAHIGNILYKTTLSGISSAYSIGWLQLVGVPCLGILGYYIWLYGYRYINISHDPAHKRPVCIYSHITKYNSLMLG